MVSILISKAITLPQEQLQTQLYNLRKDFRPLERSFLLFLLRMLQSTKEHQFQILIILVVHSIISSLSSILLIAQSITTNPRHTTTGMMESKEEQLNIMLMFILTGEICKDFHLGLDLSPISKESMERNCLSDFWHQLQLEVQPIMVLQNK